jgi:hypothetical protein
VEPAPADGTPAPPFRIRDSREGRHVAAGAVDLVARRMLVPLESDGRATARHELGHVRWSSSRLPRVRFDPRVLASVEDARVNLALAARGVGLELGAEAELYVAWLLAADQKRGDALAVWLRSIATIGTSVEPAVRALLASTGDGSRVAERMDRIRDKLEEARIASGLEAAPAPRAGALARELARALRAEGVLDARGWSASSFRIDCCTVGDDGEGARGRGRGPASDAGPDPHDDVRPGRLRVTRAILARARSAGRGPHGWRAAPEGSVVRYPARWPFDRAIFRRRGCSARGTVLIDVSGSMSLTPEDLDAMLARTGAGLVVAIYAGSDEQGELRVVAQGAQRAAPAQLRPPGSGNIVDVPALGWLARQPAPRIWVSDGRVTGVGDLPSRALRERCLALCRRARIRRVATLAEAGALVRAHGNR